MSNKSDRPGPGGGIFVGLLLLTVGAIMLLNQHFHFGNFWQLWPVFMIITGIHSLVNNGRRALFSGILLVGMGFLFLGINYGLVGLRMRHFAPLVVLIIGLGFIVDAVVGRRGRNDQAPTGGAS
ncbi:MAG: DUF5668 domain-containing protein [Candidatus Eisenbacteria bacterium]|nr:DUF5668 domain-containing protein [Candidatus Eisenbacteria bacterium]